MSMSSTVGHMPDTARRRGPRGEYAKTAQRREEILDGALQVFAESGFREGSLRDIADRVGMTHAGMRHHFPTKAALLAAVLARRDEEALQRGAAVHPHGVDVLREWIAATARNAKRPTLIDLEVTLSAEAIAAAHPAHAYFGELYARAQELLERAFHEIEQDGMLQPAIRPSAAARLVLSATIGLQQLWLWDRERDLVGELADAIDTVLARPLLRASVSGSPS